MQLVDRVYNDLIAQGAGKLGCGKLGLGKVGLGKLGSGIGRRNGKPG